MIFSLTFSIFMLITNFAGAGPGAQTLVAQIPTTARSVRFANDFRWCVATAAYQIEGGNRDSDLYHWETAAPDRVITNEIVLNPELAELLRTTNVSAMALAHACPEIQLADNPDPEGRHSVTFPTVDPNKVKLCEFSGESIDHWNRVDQDVALLHEMGIKEYRLSVEWSRIEPRRGQYDESVLGHYTDEIQKLKKAGIAPQVTLFHFSMPQWMRDQGGWENPQSAADFAEFTRRVYAAFGPQVHTWYTFNEPLVHVFAGYVTGVMPPGRNQPTMVPLVLSRILQAHALSYQALHRAAAAQGQDIEVGIAHHLRVFDPYHHDESWYHPLELTQAQIEAATVWFTDEVWNWLFFDAVEKGHLPFHVGAVTSAFHALGLNPPAAWDFPEISENDLRGSQDFLGLNYYSRDTIRLQGFGIGPVLNPDSVAQGRVTENRWEIYPEGMYRILKSLDLRGRREHPGPRPILISENGIADAGDTQRIGFLRDHLAALARARNEGVPVQGYCHWTLIDNFEWNSGYTPKFGFYAVDLQSQKRTARPSAGWMTEVIRHQGCGRPADPEAK